MRKYEKDFETVKELFKESFGKLTKGDLKKVIYKKGLNDIYFMSNHYSNGASEINTVNEKNENITIPHSFITKVYKDNIGGVKKFIDFYRKSINSNCIEFEFNYNNGNEYLHIIFNSKEEENQFFRNKK